MDSAAEVTVEHSLPWHPQYLKWAWAWGVGIVLTVTAGIQVETLHQGTATYLWADVGLSSFVHLMAIHIFESQHWINYLKTVFLSCMNDPWLRCLPFCNVHARVSSNKVTTWVGCCQTIFFLPAIFFSKCLLWLCILAPNTSHYPAILRVFISVLAHSDVPHLNSVLFPGLSRDITCPLF